MVCETSDLNSKLHTQCAAGCGAASLGRELGGGLGQPAAGEGASIKHGCGRLPCRGRNRAVLHPGSEHQQQQRQQPGVWVLRVMADASGYTLTAEAGARSVCVRARVLHARVGMRSRA